MPIIFTLRRAYQLGYPMPVSQIFLEARGEFSLAEEQDPASRRVVRTAKFRRLDGGPEVPSLRDAHVLKWNGTLLAITGVEEVQDDKLNRPQRFAQTWWLEPEAYAELARVERLFARVVARLLEVGVPVRMLPDGDMFIPGETWDGGVPRPSRKVVDD